MSAPLRARPLLVAVGLFAALAMSACSAQSGDLTDNQAQEAAPGDDTGGTDTDVPEAPDVINAIGEDQTFTCNGKSVIVNIGSVKLELLGECGTVTVNGVEAEVYVENATAIAINGSDVTVTYGGEPEVTINGTNSTADPV